jgi:putative transposase
MPARPDDAPLRAAMKAVASQRRRFDYRRIHIMLDCEGVQTKDSPLKPEENRAQVK